MDTRYRLTEKVKHYQKRMCNDNLTDTQQTYAIQFLISVEETKRKYEVLENSGMSEQQRISILENNRKRMTAHAPRTAAQSGRRQGVIAVINDRIRKTKHRRRPGDKTILRE